MKVELLKPQVWVPSTLTIGIFLFAAEAVLAVSITPVSSSFDAHISTYQQKWIVPPYQYPIYLGKVEVRDSDFSSQEASLNPLNVEVNVESDSFDWTNTARAEGSAVFNSASSGIVNLSNSFQSTMPFVDGRLVYPAQGWPERYTGAGPDLNFRYAFRFQSDVKFIIDYDVSTYLDGIGSVTAFTINFPGDGGWNVHTPISSGQGSVSYLLKFDERNDSQIWGFHVGTNYGAGVSDSSPDARFWDYQGSFNWRVEPLPSEQDNDSSNGSVPNTGSNPGSGSPPNGNSDPGQGSNPIPTNPSVPTPALIPGLIGMFLQVLKSKHKETAASR
ncbi:MAG: hypothetical protein OHK0037_38680 [Elainellaceae cyanobacterium]